MYTHICIYMCTYTCIYLYIYIYVYIHTYTSVFLSVDIFSLQQNSVEKRSQKQFSQLGVGNLYIVFKSQGHSGTQKSRF